MVTLSGLFLLKAIEITVALLINKKGVIRFIKLATAKISLSVFFFFFQ